MPRLPALRLLRPLLALLALLPSRPAAAQETASDPHAVQPERPTVATHAFTVAPGWVEIEAGLEWDRYRNRADGIAGPVVIKIGLAQRLQLDLDGVLLRAPGGGRAGFGDLALGLKWHVLHGTPLLSDFAVVASVKAPTAPTSNGLGTGTTDVTLVLVSSHELGPISMDLNFGYTRRSGSGARAPRVASLWTAAFGGPLIGALGWVAELYGYPGTAGPEGAAPIVALLGGPSLLVHPWLHLDAGIIVPIAGPQPGAVYAGGVWNVGRL